MDHMDDFVQDYQTRDQLVVVTSFRPGALHPCLTGEVRGSKAKGGSGGRSGFWAASLGNRVP